MPFLDSFFEAYARYLARRDTPDTYEEVVRKLQEAEVARDLKIFFERHTIEQANRKFMRELAKRLKPSGFATGGFVSGPLGVPFMSSNSIREQALKTMAASYRKAVDRSWDGRLLTLGYGCDNSEAERRWAAYEAGETWLEYCERRAKETGWPYIEPPLVTSIKRKDSPMPPLKIMMLCHFSFATNGWPGDRTTNAYKLFVREMEHDNLIRATTALQRLQANAPEWLFEVTDRGRVFVEALQSLPLPIPAEPKWTMPK